MPAAAVTGSHSGIGHAFAEILVREGYQVHARDMTVGESMKSRGCQTHECDASSEASIQTFATGFKGRQADLILKIAGVLHLGISKRIPVPGFIADAVRLPGIMAPHEQDTLEPTTHSVLLRTFSTNTFAPLLLTQALLPSLLLSPHPRTGLVSSRVGSIADDSSGGSYAYRASKAALNSVGKSMAIDLEEEGVVVVLMHPGYVKIGLDTSGKTHQMKEAVEPEEAAEKLWKVCMGNGIGETGRFWHREGMGLDW
ncbi:hypothetical protein HO133_005522 [Letharia lupina]|uniref:NAD(P)-binding protein n=1 Tax=Letharia lupina TaxID=560253 RepID=A0A8H6C926_9LECA|nr:uncharacterized protein HO133_005522 [Letharia lupina]KAF6218978.1 hypothetical protein HO133_005522 [Letharia lupina]